MQRIIYYTQKSRCTMLNSIEKFMRLHFLKLNCCWLIRWERCTVWSNNDEKCDPFAKRIGGNWNYKGNRVDMNHYYIYNSWYNMNEGKKKREEKEPIWKTWHDTMGITTTANNNNWAYFYPKGNSKDPVACFFLFVNIGGKMVLMNICRSYWNPKCKKKKRKSSTREKNWKLKN